MAEAGWHDEDAPRIDVTSFGERPGSVTLPGPDPERDARIEVYRDRERRRAARALDRYIEAMFLSPADVPQHLGMGESRVAADRFVEAVGDYVLARLGDSALNVQQKSTYVPSGPITPDGWVPGQPGPDSVPRMAMEGPDLADSDCLRLTERAEYCPAAGSPRCESCVWRPVTRYACNPYAGKSIEELGEIMASDDYRNPAPRMAQPQTGWPYEREGPAPVPRMAMDGPDE